MTQRSLVRLRDKDVQWLQWIPQQGGAMQAAEFETACEALAGQSIVLILPGSRVGLHQARLPATSKARLRAAAPYALEEALADDVEDLHFAIGERGADGRVDLAVVDRDWLRGLLDQLSAAGIQVSRVVPEQRLLPPPDTGYSLLVEDGWAVVRDADGGGFAVEAELLAELLPPSDTDEPQALRIHAFDASAAALAELPGAQLSEDGESVLALMRQHLGQARIDLLQGEFSPGEALGRSLKRWRLSAALALVLGGIWMAGTWFEIQSLEQSAAAMQAESENILRQTFPDIRRATRPRAQMRQRLQALRGSEQGDSGFLELLAEVGPALSADKSLTLKAVSYRRGRLELELEAGEIAALYRLQQSIAAKPGLQVSVQSANSEQGKAEGRLRIEGRAG